MTATVGARPRKRNTPNKTTEFITKKVIPPIGAILVFLLIWQLMCLGDSPNLPAPTTVLKETWDPYIIQPFFDNGGTDKGLGLQIFASLGRVAVGFTISAVVGITVGMLIGSIPILNNAVDPIFQVLRTVPPLAWLPISLAALRESNPSAIFVIFITSVWPILINTTVGVQNLSQDYRNVARVLKLRGGKYFFKILFPATVPYIFTGLRIGIGLSWLAIVAAEMLVGGVGIGFFIWDAYNSSRLSEIILALLYVGLVGLALDRLVGFIGSKVVPEEKK